ncbi:hypothetical protein AR454_28640 [Bacillus mycoides]|uniref:ApeA N-terminal domain 1-containing protein n=1 Tax=Bacillus mycoides TaxID=1405 RepID=UPI001E3FB2DE|nr:HEPN domain-containing protein [Bacillus mycoides]MCD4646334.1 hypothetical protein [Bacillus mycoides]
MEGNTNEFRLSGKWFFTRDMEIDGELYINLSKQTINLFTYSEESLGLYKEFEVITGQTIHGASMTLYKCQVVQETIQIGAKKRYRSTIIAEYAFNGVAFEAKEDVMFHEVGFRLTNLDEWAFFKGFDLYSVENACFSLIYKTPEEIKYKIDDDTSIVIHCGLQSPLFVLVEKSVSVTQKVYISIKHKTPKTFEKSLEVIRTLMNFISLNIGRAVYMTEISGYNPKHFQTISDEGEKIYHEIPIYTIELTNENYQPIDPWRVLLNLQELKENFGMYMNNWFEKSKLLSPIIDLYLNTLNYKQMSIERHFLNLVQALESYHRRTRRNYTIDPQSHQKKVQEILESAPEEHKKWLSERLNFSHEPTLQNRLLDLVPDDEDMFIFFKGSTDVEDFIKKVKNTRNYHTHYDSKLERKALKGEELEFSCVILRSMVEYYLLKEIGVSKEIIHEKLMEKSNGFYTKQSILEHYRKKNN